MNLIDKGRRDPRRIHKKIVALTVVCGLFFMVSCGFLLYYAVGMPKTLLPTSLTWIYSPWDASLSKSPPRNNEKPVNFVTRHHANKEPNASYRQTLYPHSLYPVSVFTV